MIDQNASASGAPREHVVLVHGFLSHRALMTPLAHQLSRRRDASIDNWGYPSISNRLGELASELRARIDDYASGGSRVHVVTHSMGALLARLALAHGAPKPLGRLVMIAPPHHGSPMARIFGPLLDGLLPALPLVSDAPGSFVHRIPVPACVEAGIIAARWDLLLPVGRTHLATAADHLCLPGTHASLLLQNQVVHQTDHFLNTGRFSRRDGGRRHHKAPRRPS